MDLLIQIVHKIDIRAEKRVEQECLNEFKRVANKEEILYRIGEAPVAHPDEPVREVVFPVASEQLLRDLIKEYKAKSPVFRKQVLLPGGLELPQLRRYDADQNLVLYRSPGQ